jgi:hypothetical protein
MHTPIAFVRLSPPAELRSFGVLLDRLPAQGQFLSVFANIHDERDASDLLAWLRGLSAPMPIGVVVRPTPELLVLLAREAYEFDPFLFPSDRITPHHVFSLLGRSAYSLLLSNLLSMFESEPEDSPIVHSFIQVGISGGGLAKFSALSGLRPAAAYRWCAGRGLPTPGIVLRILRMAFVELSTELGWSGRDARRFAGWLSNDAYLQARSRLTRREGLESMRSALASKGKAS